ncbi:Cysteine-rich protein A [Hyphomonas oceanitis SCH89]|uniref:Cysteine-rich protein A n=2 Tax=Hyphomonas oceanitis TaxID=81033 RepID=A0A059GAU2_9PROT|nr:Cysteine-rich protein A [Hyphomonas oceanitis SCH89]
MSQAWKSILQTLGAAITLMALAPSAMAESTDATVKADMAACKQANDNKACEQAYDFYAARLDDAKGKKAAGYLADMVVLADTGCAAGNGWLCTEIGDSHEDGIKGRAEDLVLALQYHMQACELGNGLGCARVGMVHQRGKGVPKDAAEATRYYLKACAMGGTDGCQYQAYLVLLQYLEEIPYSEDSIETLKSRCADTGLDGRACVELGNASFFGAYDMPEDEKQARIYWGKGCARAVYAQGCTLRGLLVMSDTDMSDPHSPDNLSGIQSLYRGCLLGDLPACEFMVVAGQEYAWNDQDVIAQGMYGRCLAKPSVEDCTMSGKAFRDYRFPEHPLKGELASDKSMRALTTACREFTIACVDVANSYLEDQKFTMGSANLAIGVLESACEKGDAAACARKDEVVAETGGVTGSYIDPMLDDDERFLLARFDIESGETQRGRETMQWLAFMGHTHAQLYLAYAYENGLSVAQKDANGNLPDLPYTVSDKAKMIYELFDAAAKKGVPDAAMKVAVTKYYENDHEGSDSYEFAIGRAQYLGAEGANEFYAAVVAQDKARTDARIANIQAMHRQNIESRDNMDRQTVQSAWDQYYKRQEERKEAEGGEVCGTVYGEGNSTYRTCMSRATAMKHYRGNF